MSHRSPANGCPRVRLIVAVGLLAAGGLARADLLTVLVLIDGDGDREQAVRIQGQTTDLPVAVAIAEASLAHEPGGLPAAARAAASRGEVAVWFSTDRGTRVVFVARGDRLLVRRVGGASGAMSHSASVEAVALAVRTALSALAAGGEIGVEEHAASDSRTALRAWAEVGWAGVLDGERAAGHHGVAVRFGGASGRWRLAAALGFHPAAAMGTGPAAVQVERQEAGLVLGIELLAPFPARPPRWSVGIELGLGLARFPRVTTSVGAGFTPTAAHSSSSPFAGAAVRVGRRLTAGSSLVLGLGADLLARPPEYGVETAGGFERVAALRPLEPRGALSLLLDTP